MTTSTARVPAKINLALAVGPRRDDGYHDVATVFQTLDLHDEVRATARPDGQITVRVHADVDEQSERADVPTGDDNLAVRAARRLAEVAGVESGVDLVIRKVIPVAGGMAGGSADAAATLVACNAVWKLGLGREVLDSVAADLGSDVPFLLHGGTAVGTGRGERISPALARGSYRWVVATAAEGLSTPDVYAELDRLDAHREVSDPQVSEDVLAALRSGSPAELGTMLTNDLQKAAISLRPELRDTLDVGLGAGALGGIVSGSGPTCVFLVHDEQHGLDVSFALASSLTCADVIQARGPVPGARLLS